MGACDIAQTGPELVLNSQAQRIAPPQPHKKLRPQVCTSTPGFDPGLIEMSFGNDIFRMPITLCFANKWNPEELGVWFLFGDSYFGVVFSRREGKSWGEKMGWSLVPQPKAEILNSDTVSIWDKQGGKFQEKKKSVNFHIYLWKKACRDVSQIEGIGVLG